MPCRQSPETLRRHLADPEVLLRINPYLVFKRWEKTGPDRYRAEFHNETNQLDFQGDIDIEQRTDGTLVLHLRKGLKQRIFFSAEAAPNGSQLIVVDDYEGPSEADRESRKSEVDRSIVAWGEALRRYFVRQRRYGWLPGWRWFIRRVWMPMKPSHRRILWLLWLFTLFDTAIVALGFAIWFIEYSR
ncbi:MAG: hypothetical protein A2140_01340 [Candidatus Muproteobacteria bacterium RBG_16_62_13]|uniref:Uncharacterized protein n=1 Tax=Candidatus Muproteobacteria bacterium RBG_16_62_13 TaxID=1817756 RepID=A0A1F6SWW9_9PROT|nr:MAG: hypothetical protein A2140_01340 [Candidatus Muproteobacteria bacterium RBG_16_62_13]